MSIEVRTNSSAYGNFNFALMNYDYYNVENDKMYHRLNDILSNHNGTKSISYNELLKSGTYFIYLRGNQNSSITNDLPYSISLNITKTEKSPNILVSDLYHTNYDIKGAVWLSDFIPANDFSIFNLNRDCVYYKPIEQDLDCPDYALDALSEISNGAAIKLASYYIWDPLIKHVLHEIFNTLKEQFKNMLLENDRIAGELTLKQDNITGTISLIANIAGYLPVSLPVSIAINIINEIGFSVIDQYFNAIMPVFNVNQSFYLAYLASIAAYTDLGLNDYEKNSINEIYKNDNKKIIEIPIYYTLGVNKATYPAYDEHYYSLKVTSLELINKDSLIYNEDYFYSSCLEDYYCRGKIYVLKDFNDIIDLTSLELAVPHNHIYDNHYCIICNEYTSAHDYDYAYAYLNPTTHKAYCICGKYIVQGHAIASGSSKCIQCGEQVDMGFIEINAHLKETY